MLPDIKFTHGRLPLSAQDLIALLGGWADHEVGTVERFEAGEKGPTAHDRELIEVREVALADALRMVDEGEITDGKTIAALWHVRS